MNNEEKLQFKEELKDTFVTKDDCHERREETDRRFATDDKRISMILHDFNIMKWLLGIVATATVGQFISTIFERMF